MATLMIKAEMLSVGDTLVLPFGRTATVKQIKPVGQRAQFVRFQTEHGWTRVEVGSDVNVEAKVL